MALYLDQQRVAVGGDLLAQRIGIHTIAHRDASNPQLMLSGVNTSLRRFFALSAAIALNIRLRVCLTVATPFDRMACKVKSWLPHIKLIQNFLQSLEPPFVVGGCPTSLLCLCVRFASLISAI